jgi:hypothetical protein
VRSVKGTPSGQAWLLVQGQVAEYMGDLERVRLYSFDGYHFREEWNPEDRLDMRLKTSGGEVNARYLSPRISQTGGDFHNCMEENLEVGASGLLFKGVLNHGACDDFENAK